MSDISGKSRYKAGDVIVDKYNRILELIRLKSVGLYAGRVSDLWEVIDCDTGSSLEVWLDRKH